MNEMKNDIVTLVTMMGEIVGRVKEETQDAIVLKNPLLFVPANDDAGGGFAPGVSMTGAQGQDKGTFNKSCILTIMPCHEQVADGWTKATGSIILAK